MKALVTGGTGFIGSNVVKNLLAKGIQVRILTRSKNSKRHLKSNQIETVLGDILDVNSLEECAKDVDLVYSAFGILGQWGIPEQLYWDINTKGVKNLLQACLDSNIKQFIHISSAGVLGPLPDGVVADESFPFNPSNIYEQTKCDAEKAIYSHGEKYGLPFTIIRPEFVYGPGDTHVLGLFKAIRARRFVLLGNGNSLLHPTYIDDLIQALNLCEGNQNALQQTFLITGPKPLTVKELAHTIAGESAVSLPKARIPAAVAHITARALEIAARMANFEPVLTKSRVNFFTQNRAFTWQKAKNEIGFSPQVDFREGVRKTLSWYQQNEYL